MEKGADRGAKDDHGDSAVEWARKGSRREIVKAIEREDSRGRAKNEPQVPLRRMGDDNTVARAVETGAGPLWLLAGFGLLWCTFFWPWFRNRPEEMTQVNAAECDLIASGRSARSATKG